jgi:hypothetical protein
VVEEIVRIGHHRCLSFLVTSYEVGGSSLLFSQYRDIDEVH